MKRTSLAFVACFLALVVVSCACRQKKTQGPVSVGPGVKAPAFDLYDLENNRVSLRSLKGKVVLLDFWATWCYPCRMEIPHFIDLYEKYYQSGLEVVGIALDRGGAKDVRPFAEKEGIIYRVLIGDTLVTKAYGGISAIPTTFVIDKKGVVYSKYVGVPKDMNVFENDVKKLLGK